jgi:cyclophilin family peptidyl-prolyl cis-trans isomerase
MKKFDQTAIPEKGDKIAILTVEVPTDTITTETSATSPDTPSKNATENPTGTQAATPETTTEGIIKIRLFGDKTPEMVKNFTTLAEEGKYTNVIFHRIIPDFVIQGGDFERGNGTGGYSYKGPGTELDDEINPSLKHVRGAASMANAGPNTNGSQFFIVLPANASFLDGGYSIFGQVFEGMDVVDKIAAVQTDENAKPLKDVVIKSVKITEYQ